MRGKGKDEAMTREVRATAKSKSSRTGFMGQSGSMVQGCCTRCEHSQSNLTFCYGRSPSRKVQEREYHWVFFKIL